MCKLEQLNKEMLAASHRNAHLHIIFRLPMGSYRTIPDLVQEEGAGELHWRPDPSSHDLDT